jgi:hypothetical protein
MLLDNIKVNTQLKFSEDYHSDLNKFKFWESSYAADSGYAYGKDERGNPIISRFTCEEESDYSDRLKKVTCRSHITNIINRYNSSVFGNGVSRSFANAKYQEWLYNVDGYGSTMSEFMRGTLLEAQIYGKSYFWVDSSASESEVTSIATSESVSSIFRKIEIQNIVSYEEINNKLTEILFLVQANDGEWLALYFNANERVTLHLSNQGNSYTIKSIDEVVEHGYSQIPVVKCEPDIFSESQVASIAGSLKKVTNYLSLRDAELYDQTFTRFIISGIRQTDNEETGQKNSIQWGTRRMLMVEDGNVKVDRVGADVSQSESLTKAIVEEEIALYRSASLQASDPFKTGESASGLAKIVDRNEFENIAKALMNAVESAENTGAELAMEAIGISDFVDVTYEDPQVADEATDISNLREVLALSIPQVIKDVYIKRFVESNLELSDEDLLKLDEQLSQTQSLIN